METLKYESIKSKLSYEYAKRSEENKLSSEFGGAALARAAPRAKGGAGPRGGKKNGAGRPQRDKSSIRCWRCKQTGHFKNECPVRDSQPAKKDESKGSDDEPLMFSARSTPVSDKTWTVDSGASSHLSGKRQWFKTFKELETPIEIILAGAGCNLKATGVGTVELEHANRRIMLCDVLYVPGVITNLLSVRHMTGRGLQVAFANDESHHLRQGRQGGCSRQG